MGEEFRLGMGTLCFWGNTPALDLQGLFPFKETDEDSHILLLGQCDMRHVLKTLSIIRNQLDKSLHFYIWEPHPLLYARQMLFLKLATLPTDQAGIHAKVLAFVEILGNILVRPQTMKLIEKCCEELIQCLTNEKVLSQTMPFMHTEDLKYKDRDMIVEILRYWSKPQKHLSASQMNQLWDGRVRRYLTTRYDSRMGVFDWDYQMRMTEKNSDTKIVNVKEYKNWRNLGIAFVEFEADYNKPNVTLFPCQGSPFHGEILVGPFIPYGIQCEDASYFEMTNKMYKKKSYDLTFHNVEEILTALSPESEGNLVEVMQNVKIHFVPLDACENMWKKSKFQGKFDGVLCSNHSGHKVKPELVKLVKHEGKIVVDQSKYMWYFRDANDAAYTKKVIELGETAGLSLKAGDKGQLVFENSESRQEESLKEDNDLSDNGSKVTTDSGAGDCPPQELC